MEIPGYRIIKPLGKGGMASVYLAVQESVDREVALKIMAPHLLADPSFGDRFLREARIAAKLHHRHVVGVVDVGKHEQWHYIAMEYLPGGSISGEEGKGIDPLSALRITREIARALAYAHSKGFIHRDIKPDNILLRDDGSAALTDFGIARAADSATKMTRAGSVVGTPHYMSPEQARGLPLDGRSDLYSLGVLLYELLVGEVPFQADDPLAIGIMHITEPVPELPENLAALQDLVDRMMAKQAADRFQNGDDVAESVAAYEIAIAEGELPEVMQPDPLQRERILNSLSSTARITRVTPADVAAALPGGRADPITEKAAALAGTAVMPQLSGTAVLPSLERGDAVDRALARSSAEPRTQQRTKQSAAVRPKTERGIRRVEDAAAAAAAQSKSRKPLWIGLMAGVAVLVLVLWFAQEPLRAWLVPGDVNVLFAKAALAEQQGRLVGEERDNADAIYRSILDDDPDNERAQAGRRSVGERLIQRARAELTNNDVDAARITASQAREILQGGPDLEELDENISGREGNVDELESLLKRGNAALEAGRYAGSSDAALELFQQLLEIDPSNSFGYKGVKQSLDGMSQQAQAFLDQSRFDDAQRVIGQIEIASPNYAQLPELQQRLIELRGG